MDKKLTEFILYIDSFYIFLLHTLHCKKPFVREVFGIIITSVVSNLGK